MRNKYQRTDRKSNHKFEVVGGQELLVRVPLPIAEVWAEMQAQVEQLTGQAGLQILRAILENEVTHRVGPPHRPHPRAGCVRWGKQPGYVVFAGQKIPLERPRVRTREARKWNWRATVSCSKRPEGNRVLQPSFPVNRLHHR
jgi:putative transposase